MGHSPAAAYLAIIDNGLGVATIFVVAKHGIPGHHKLGMRVDEFVVGHPKRVGGAFHAVEVVNIAGGNNEFRTCAIVSHITHQFGNGFLVVVAISTGIVNHEEVEGVVEYRVVDVLGIDC